MGAAFFGEGRGKGNDGLEGAVGRESRGRGGVGGKESRGEGGEGDDGEGKRETGVKANENKYV